MLTICLNSNVRSGNTFPNFNSFQLFRSALHTFKPMAAKDFLQNRVGQTPTIYAYELVGVPDHEGLIKVEFTVRDVEERIKEQLGTIT